MVCLSCHRLTNGRLCPACAAGLRPGPDRLLGGDLRARAAFAHAGSARAVVHNFKYRGIEPAGVLLAEAMAPMVPEGVVLVPLPRVAWRVIRYGLAPAAVLARHLSRLTGLPVAHLLTAPLIGQDQARRSRTDRRAPMFSLQRPPSGPVLLIDDVITTGGTLRSARQTLGSAVASALAATASPR